jgi:hypothetical protein
MAAMGPSGIQDAGFPAFAKRSGVFTLRDDTRRAWRWLGRDAYHHPPRWVKVGDVAGFSALPGTGAP